MKEPNIMPKRHLALVEIVVGLLDKAENPENGVPVQQIIDKARLQPSYWHCYLDGEGADGKGTYRSDEVEEDIDELHSRGFLFVTKEDDVFLTRNAETAYDIVQEYRAEKGKKP